MAGTITRSGTSRLLPLASPQKNYVYRTLFLQKYLIPEGCYSSPHERDETLGSQTLDHFSNQQMAVVHRCQGQSVGQIHKWASLVNVIDGSKSIFYLNLNINSLFYFTYYNSLSKIKGPGWGGERGTRSIFTF